MLGLWGHLPMRLQRAYGAWGAAGQLLTKAHVGRNSWENSAGVKGKDKIKKPTRPGWFLRMPDLADSSVDK